MGIVLFKPGSVDIALFGTVGDAPDPSVRDHTTSDYSVAEAVRTGHPVVVDDMGAELDRHYAGDRALLAVGLRAGLWVPMHFGDEVGGTLFFGKREPHWYDSVDVEVATAVASRMVLGIQHQRLAEEQRRLASMERRARSLEQSLKTARSELHQRYGFEQMIGRSPVFREALTRAAQVARTETTVLITGESGTGKELFARYAHRMIRDEGRSGFAPFIKLNCAALPETLMESELFGYEKGSFTDARSDKKGLFEMAEGGSILLDEIGEMKLSLQGKLLRVLEERTVRPIGGSEEIPIDVTVIATTNRNLKDAVEKGEFRMDLFYRLNTFYLLVPPLRDRKDDIPLLARHYLSQFATRFKKKTVKSLAPETEEVLKSYPWPGNIRELRNLVERLVVLESADVLLPEHLPNWLMGPSSVISRTPDGKFTLPENGISLDELEKDLILQALERTKNNKAQAAKLLKISYDTLRYQVKKFGLE